MRRIAWVFALFGATGLAGRTASSADPSTRTRLGQAPKTAATAPETAPRSRQLKNYADELFGTEADKEASFDDDAGAAVVKTSSAKTPAAKTPETKATTAKLVDNKTAESKTPAVKATAAKGTTTGSKAAPKEDDNWAFVADKDLFQDADELEAANAHRGISSVGLAPRTKEPAAAEAAERPASTPATKKIVVKDAALDDAPAAEKNAIVPVAGEAAPWAKSRVQSAEFDRPATDRDSKKLTPAAGTRTPATSSAAPAAPPAAATRTPVAANRLSVPIDVEPAEEMDAEEPQPDVIPPRKSGLTISRSPVAERPRTPATTSTAGPAFRPGAARTLPTAAKSTHTTPAANPFSAPAVPTAPPVAAASAPTAAPVAKVDAAVPNVTVAWKSTGSINIGQECTCQLVVKNHGSAAASDIAIEATFPKNVRLVSAEPKPISQTGFLGWGIDSLAAGEETIISVKLIPTERGRIDTDARVRFSGTAKNTFTVSEPMLALKVEGPKQVLVGDPAAHNVLITNPGTGVATNVKIEAVIPKGLEHAKGERLVMDLGSLNPGETRNIRLACAAVTGGNHKIQVRAIADADLAESAASEISVIAPQIKAEIEGPGLRYLGRNGVFHLHVTNDGSVATDNVRVLHKVPEGFDFVSAGTGATHDAGNRLLSWYVGHLEPGQKSDLEVTLVAAKAGEFTHYVRATSESGAVNDTQFSTRVEGTPALVLSVRDLADPVEVGVETAYEIQVKNEGSASASNVGMTLELPQGIQYLDATGPGSHTSEKGLVTFRPVAELGPGKSLTFTLKVKGQTSGNVRLRTRLTSDSIDEPIVADEVTRFYQ